MCCVLLARVVSHNIFSTPLGRTDHTFRYERKDLNVGLAKEGRFRLTLMVAGDKLTTLRYTIHLPTPLRKFLEFIFLVFL